MCMCVWERERRRLGTEMKLVSCLENPWMPDSRPAQTPKEADAWQEMTSTHGTMQRAWSVVSDSAASWTVAHQAPLSMGCPNRNTGVGCHFLLQGIFPTQGLNCIGRWILYHGATWEATDTRLLLLLLLSRVIRVWLFATPWTVTHQAPPSMEFSRQEYWSGVPLPSPNTRLCCY